MLITDSVAGSGGTCATEKSRDLVLSHK